MDLGKFNCADCKEWFIKTGHRQERCTVCAKLNRIRLDSIRQRKYYKDNWVEIRAGKHHISSKQLFEMYESQGRCCAICLIELPLEVLEIDHDHSCCLGGHSCGNCIRGLLCRSHNKALGLCHDSIQELGAMIKYLSNYDENGMIRDEEE